MKQLRDINPFNDKTAEELIAEEKKFLAAVHTILKHVARSSDKTLAMTAPGWVELMKSSYAEIEGLKNAKNEPEAKNEAE